MAKILGILSAVILAISALIAIKNNARLAQEIEDEKTIAAVLKENQTKLKEAQAMLTGLPDEIAATEATTVEAEERVAELSEQAEILKKEIDEKTAKIEENDNKLEVAHATLTKAKDTEQFIAKIKQARAEAEQLNQTISGREAHLANLTAEAAEAQQRAESLRDKVNSMSRGSSHQSLETRIKSVYPNWGFVTLASGTGAGVVGGSKLVVVRDNEVVANLLVTTVEQNSSSASIVPDSMTDGVILRSGDKVVAGSEKAQNTESD